MARHAMSCESGIEGLVLAGALPRIVFMFEGSVETQMFQEQLPASHHQIHKSTSPHEPLWGKEGVETGSLWGEGGGRFWAVANCERA